MAVRFAEYSVFLREFRRNFRATGALLPSGKRLALAVTRHIAESRGPQRILEVGPGTGAVTRFLVPRMGAQSTLDLVEGNEAFVDCLNNTIQTDDAYAAARTRIQVHHSTIEAFRPEKPFDVIISGLPLNNFLPDEVESVLQHLRGMAADGCTFSFFEYMGIRRIKGIASSRNERERLRGISEIMGRWLTSHETYCDWIWPNVPPAWVHHLQFAD